MALSTGSFYTVSSNDTSRGYAIAADDASYKFYDNITWSMWLAAGPGNSKHVWSLWEQVSGNARTWLISTQTDGSVRIGASWDGTNSGFYKTAAPACLDFSWHHVVFTFASGSFYAYVDGVSRSLTTVVAWTGGAVAMHASDEQHIINAHSASAPVADTGIGGCMSNFSLWNKVLSTAEILEIYNNGVPGLLTGHSAVANLTNWIRMDQSDTAPTLIDSIDSGGNLTIVQSGTSGNFKASANAPITAVAALSGGTGKNKGGFGRFG